MASSILGIIVFNIGEEPEEQALPENTFEYKDYLFAEDEDGHFWAKGVINGREYPEIFRADPRNLSEIYITQDAVSRILNAKKVYISFNPNQQGLGEIRIATYQIARIIAKLNIPVVGAYSEDADPIEPNIPIRDCSKSLEWIPVIMLELGDETKITSGDCIYVRGATYDELILAADKLGMHLVGIRI